MFVLFVLFFVIANHTDLFHKIHIIIFHETVGARKKKLKTIKERNSTVYGTSFVICTKWRIKLPMLFTIFKKDLVSFLFIYRN